MTYYKQNRHQEHISIHDILQTEQTSGKHFNSRHTTNRTDIKKNILIHDILQTEQTSRKTF
jgi:hypothetical protein